MKHACLLLALCLCFFARGQLQLDPWLHSLQHRPLAAWIEHSGPQPGLNQAVAWGRYERLSGGISWNALGPQAWIMSEIPVRGTAELAFGLGWDGLRPQILTRWHSGPWVVAALPLSGTWSATWRQRQTSGWILTAHVEQNVIALRTEWTLGIERNQLALYASSLGRWRAVLNHRSLRIAVGGGRTTWSSLGYATPAP
jgi:hypothetical protein